VTPPLQHAEAVYGAVFSPDGSRVATFSKDHTARVWDASTGEPLTLPLQFGDEVTSATFDPRGSTLLVSSKDRSVRLIDLAPEEKAPDWLADLAAFTATQVRYDVDRPADVDQVSGLREKLLASTSDDPWEKFGRWYFTDSENRAVSPWSTLSLKAYVENLMALGDRDSLDYAITLARDHPAWMVKLVPLRAKAAPSATKEKSSEKD
jgi:WD40 repeat protein